MKRNSLKGFTLIEILIVMVIIGVLAVVLCESYIAISKLALRIEQQKNINDESLTLTQVLQSIADNAQIDYSKYHDKLDQTNGYTGTLYLTGGAWANTSIYITGNCPPLAQLNATIEESIDMQAYTDCKLVIDQELEKDHIITNLVSSKKVIPSQIQFRIIPYNSDESYFSSNEDNVINSVHQQAFWLFIRLYTPLYQPNSNNDITQPLQLFFNLNA